MLAACADESARGLRAGAGTGGSEPAPPPPPPDDGTPSTPDAAPPDPGPIVDAGNDGLPLEPTPFLGRVESGTRIKAQYARMPDGSKYFLFEFWDEMLKTSCDFGTAEDDKIRCLPFPPSNPFRTYSDAACTEQLLPADAACAGGYGIRTNGNRNVVFKLGAPVVSMGAYSKQVDASGTTRCLPDATARGKMFFSAGATVPATMFAEAERSRAHILPNRRLHPWVRQGADGLRERHGWWDSKYQQLCGIGDGTVAGDGQRRCLPTFYFILPFNRYADPGCTQNMAQLSAGSYPETVFARIVDSTMCPARAIYYKTERIATPASVYWKDNTGACKMAAGDPALTSYLIKDIVPPSEFVKFTEVLEGSGRLLQRVLTAEDGAVDRPSRPVDRQYGDLCEFGLAEDGKLRCALRSPQSAQTYGDATCMRRLGSPTHSVACNLIREHTFAEGPWCKPVFRTFQLGAQVTAPYQLNAAGACVAAPNRTVHELGAAVSPATQPEAQLVIE